MFPLTAAEIGADFNLSDSIQWGNLPSVVENKPAAQEYLSSYMGTYLREEVLQEGLT